MSTIKSLLSLPRQLVEQSISKKSYLAFSKKFDFVYFGYVNQHTDEHELVRGLTLSPRHTDTNYSIGNFNGTDVTLVQRTDVLSFPGKAEESYTWDIMQFDLTTSSHLPHIFIDANHHDEAFYANMFIKFTSFKPQNGYFIADKYQDSFNRRFKIYTPPDVIEQAMRIFTPEVAAELASRYGHFDFEIYEDRLLVYATNAVINLKTLEHMFKAGMYLSEVCNSYIPPEQIA